jgi:hypothetical protein
MKTALSTRVLLPILKNCINVIRRPRVAISIVSVLLLVPAIGYSAITAHGISAYDVKKTSADNYHLSFVLATRASVGQSASVDQTQIHAAVPVPATLPLFISSVLSGLVAINSNMTMKYSWFVLSNQVGNRGQAAFLYVY